MLVLLMLIIHQCLAVQQGMMLVLQSRGHMEVMKFLLVKEATAKTGCVVQWEATCLILLPFNVMPEEIHVGGSY